jgi:hypothetical protein
MYGVSLAGGLANAEKVRQSANFADGGLVGGTGFGDSVRANLTPGEFVVRKSAVENFGVDFFETLNSGEVSGGSNVTVNISDGGLVGGTGFGDSVRANFADGGLVGGTGFGDSVRANLTPGEVVIKKSAVDTFGAEFFEAINNGEGGGGSSVNITINGGIVGEESYVRDQLIPQIQEGIRNA